MLTLKDIQAARERIRHLIYLTPLERSTELDERGILLFSKLETLQRTGSFKIRGALNKILSLTESERKQGVIAASMGNHAQGVALAAKLTGIAATVIMPTGAPLVKLENTRNYGAQVIEFGKTVEESLDYAKRMAAEKQFVFVPPFDDEAIIAGQGTIGLEILQQLPDIDEVIVSIGGGGLISGIALALKESKRGIVVTGVRAANTKTFADGIRVTHPGEICSEYIKKYVDQIVAVQEDEIASSVLSLMDRSKAVVEGAAAATLAAVQKGLAGSKGKKTVLVLSGGNIDFTQISRILTRGLAQMGRVARIRVLLPDVPGTLASLLAVFRDEGANVLEIEHDRTFYSGPVNSTQVRVTLETKGKAHVAMILEKIKSLGYAPEQI